MSFHNLRSFPSVDVYVPHLVIFFFIFTIYTDIYIHTQNLFPLFQTPRTRTHSNPLFHHKILPIFCFKTSFEIPSTRAFIWYQIYHDPSSFFERVFRSFSTSRLVLNVSLASIICITDPINLRISRGTTYCNFIEI